MELQHHTRLLRMQLLCMARMSQRALDDSIKGYALGNTDFCLHVRSAEHRLGEHHRQIKYLCRNLSMIRVIPLSESRFILAALRLDKALYGIYRVATHIAQDTILFLSNNLLMKCVPLDQFGKLVNSLVRLCIIALFEKDASSAELVHDSQRVWRRCELTFDHSFDDADQQINAEDFYALATMQNLGAIAKQAHEMADAILFWLNGRENGLALEADGYDVLSFLSEGGSNYKKTGTNLLSLVR